jgi:hypothetical protein
VEEVDLEVAVAAVLAVVDLEVVVAMYQVVHLQDVVVAEDQRVVLVLVVVEEPVEEEGRVAVLVLLAEWEDAAVVMVVEMQHAGMDVAVAVTGMAGMAGVIVEGTGGEAIGGSGGAAGGIPVHHSGDYMAMDAGCLMVDGRPLMLI